MINLETLAVTALKTAASRLAGFVKCAFLAACRLFHHPMTKFVIELVS